MAVLRSTQLAAAHLTPPANWHVLYTCPAGHRAVVRDARFINNSGASAAQFYFQFVSSGGVNVLLAVGPLDQGKPLAWVGDVVLLEGDVLRAYSSADACEALVSGAELPILSPEQQP